MSKLIYSMGVSLDGFIAAADGTFDWSAPDEELHRFHNRQTQELGAVILGRRLYEVMSYWETADQDPTLGEPELEFARIWQEIPKVVFSRTLDSVEGKARLATDSPAEELARLREEVGGDLSVGGAGLAATFVEQGLVDEFRQFVNPVVVGGGTPFFPSLDRTIDLKLVEERVFGSRVVYLRHVSV